MNDETTIPVAMTEAEELEAARLAALEAGEETPAKEAVEVAVGAEEATV